MVRSVILGLFVAAALVLGYVAYENWNQRREFSGAVVNGPQEPPQPMPAESDSERQLKKQSDPERPASTSESEQDAPAKPAAGGTMTAEVPQTDTIPPQPPNGVAFASKGRFEVYRQGNLTWRIDTETGAACVLFATNEEWRKPQVYRHGCASGAVQ
jgi:hypothetical protein